MPKLTKADPKYCHHKSDGRAFVRIGGRVIYLGKYNSPESREAYHRLIGIWRIQGRPETFTLATDSGSSDLAVCELLAAFLTHAERYYPDADGKPSSEVGCFKDAIRHVRVLFGATPVAEFGPMALKTVRESMVQNGGRPLTGNESPEPSQGKKKGRAKSSWSRQYVNKQIHRIRRIFKWGVENEMVPVTVLNALQTVGPLKYGRTDANESKRVKPVADAWVDAVIAKVAPPVAAMIELQRLTGMRSGEVVIMRACDIDTTGNVWIYRPASHKNAWREHERKVFLGPIAQTIVRRFFKPSIDAFLFSPADAIEAKREARAAARKTPLSCGNRTGTNRTAKPTRPPGARYKVPTYRRAIARGCDQADVPRWHPHQLRHNHGTAMRKQYGLEAARIMLGHKTAGITEIYAEADLQKAVEIAGEIG